MAGRAATDHNGLGKRLYSYRCKNSLTLQQLSDILKIRGFSVSVPTLSRLETGKRRGSFRVRRDVLTFLRGSHA